MVKLQINAVKAKNLFLIRKIRFLILSLILVIAFQMVVCFIFFVLLPQKTADVKSKLFNISSFCY